MILCAFPYSSLVDRSNLRGIDVPVSPGYFSFGMDRGLSAAIQLIDWDSQFDPTFFWSISIQSPPLTSTIVPPSAASGVISDTGSFIVPGKTAICQQFIPMRIHQAPYHR